MSEATSPGRRPPVGTRRPGGRSARTRSAVLAAVIELLAEGGYDALSIDEVARRAGVHRTTVYRRWPSKVALVTEATRERSAEQVPVPDTGSLAGDLRALARAVAANVGSGVGRVVTRNLVAATVASDELATGAHGFWAHRLALTGEIVRRAVERGEVDAGTDPDLVIETLIGPLYVRLLLTGEPVDADLADRVADLVAAGVTRATGTAEARGRGRGAPG